MEPEHLINALLFAVEQCAKSGLDRNSTAEKLNISPAEFDRLLAELPQLGTAFEKGVDQAPAQQVEAALLKRALGFEQKEIYS
ncbi:MAG: hypothetical protein PHV59_00375, partial [Victivallales bacterium]|nr:hypothetical protein [Victivallales bacterium]